MTRIRIKYLLAFALIIMTMTGNAQDEEERVFFFGFDMGPKYDHYTSTQIGGLRYSPSLEIVPDIGATAGIVGGFFLDNKYIVELGIFRNNFKVKIDFKSPQGNVFFANTLVNTFSSYSLPIHVGARIKSNSQRSLLFFQTGITTLFRANLDFDIPKYSIVDQRVVDNQVTDELSYEIFNDRMDGKIMTLDVGLTWNYAVRTNLFLTTAAYVKYGIAGQNLFNVIHHTRSADNSAAVRDVQHQIQTNGTGAQLTLGFRYFMFEE